MERVFSKEDRAAFGRLKDKIRQDLKQQEADSPAIVATAQDMARIKRLEWHLMDDIEDPDAWAHATFGIGMRQASKYFLVGERLRPEQVAGAGMGLEALYQLAMAPKGLRRDLLALVKKEKLSSGALAAGRQAALPLWEAGDRAGARTKLAEKAVASQKAQDAERAKKNAERAEETPEDTAAGVERALKRAEKGLEKLAGAMGGRVSDKARRLAQAAQEQVAELRALLEEGGALEEEEEADESPEEEAAVSEVQNFQDGPADPPGPPSAKTEMDVAQVATAMRGMEWRQQEDVAMHLFFIMRGDPVEEEIGFFADLRGPLLQAGVPEVAFEESLRRLGDPDHDRRGVFALRLYVEARLPKLYENLWDLLQMDLPPGLTRAVELVYASGGRAAAPAHPP
jgi:hypothetical protein